MAWTYIALENPLPLLGSAKAAQRQARQKKEKDKKRKKGKGEKEAPLTRRQFIELHQGSLDEGQLKADRTAIRRYCGNHEAALSDEVESLQDVMDKICAHARARGDKLGTLIFVGHGSATSISVGIGQGPIGETFAENLDAKELKKAKSTATELFGIHDRMIGFTNLNKWVPLFAGIKNAVEEDGNQRFNVLLLGCSTGEFGNDAAVGHLLEFVAKNVHHAFAGAIGVAAYGLTNSVDQQETETVLANLEEVKALQDGKHLRISDSLFVRCAHHP